nr:SAF domain-containing protein [Ornithinimicrobium sp. F0845]
MRASIRAAQERGRRRDADRRAVWRRGVLRKALAAVLCGAAVYAAVTALAPEPPAPGPLVLVADHDVPVGAELGADSVRVTRVPEGLVPGGALSDPAQVQGRVTTAPLRAGEILTDLRVSASASLEGLDPELVLAHLPLRDASLAGVLQPGTRVDVLTTTDGAVLAADVLLVRRVTDQDAAGPPRADADALSFLVAVTPEQAGRLAAGGADLPGHGLTVVIRG